MFKMQIELLVRQRASNGAEDVDDVAWFEISLRREATLSLLSGSSSRAGEFTMRCECG